MPIIAQHHSNVMFAVRLKDSIANIIRKALIKPVEEVSQPSPSPNRLDAGWCTDTHGMLYLCVLHLPINPLFWVAMLMCFDGSAAFCLVGTVWRTNSWEFCQEFFSTSSLQLFWRIFYQHKYWGYTQMIWGTSLSLSLCVQLVHPFITNSYHFYIDKSFH